MGVSQGQNVLVGDIPLASSINTLEKLWHRDVLVRHEPKEIKLELMQSLFVVHDANEELTCEPFGVVSRVDVGVAGVEVAVVEVFSEERVVSSQIKGGHAF